MELVTIATDKLAIRRIGSTMQYTRFSALPMGLEALWHHAIAGFADMLVMPVPALNHPIRLSRSGGNNGSRRDGAVRMYFARYSPEP